MTILKLDTSTENPTEQEPTSPPADEQLSRGHGILMLLVFCFFTYWSIVSPMLAVSRHEESIRTSLAGMLMMPICLVCGIIVVTMGGRAGRILGTRKNRPSALGWAIYIIAFGLGVLLQVWFKNVLKAHGY